MNIDECLECGAPYVHFRSGEPTTVDYLPRGTCLHDDNCVKRRYLCKNRHSNELSVRRRCNDKQSHYTKRPRFEPMCDWKGKAKCSCDKHPKVDRWPEIVKLSAEDKDRFRRANWS